MAKLDYAAIARQYAKDVVAGKILTCKWVQRACERQLADLNRFKGKDSPYRFNPKLTTKDGRAFHPADNLCAFIERLPHVKGPLAGEPITLEPWQVFILSTVFGWVKADGTRRFRRSYIEVPRGNAKSTLSSAVGLHNKARAVAFTLPGSNVRYKGLRVQDGFRLAVYEQLSDARTQVQKNFAVKDMLYFLEGGQITIASCPSCGQEGPYHFKSGQDISRCENCNSDVYVTDVLRIHEQISDHGDNSSAMTRFMNAVEHLQLTTLVKAMADVNFDGLCNAAIMVDGPLALFGQPAKFHASIQAFYSRIFQRCLAEKKNPPLIIGLQKDGMVMEHARSLSPHLKNGTYCSISDEYRAEFINGIAPLTDNFGHETYYGQDFIYKTDSGRIFDVCLAYPFGDKLNRKNFAKQKAESQHYEAWLSRAFKLIRHLEFDLYENSVVPVALAHRHASISLSPGGTLLDVLTKKHLGDS